MTEQATQAISDKIEEWLERQPSFSYDPADIVVDRSARPSWARVWGTENLRNGVDVPHVISFKLALVDGFVLSAHQHRYQELQAKAICRGQALLDTYGQGPDIQDQCAAAAQDAMVDIMEALEYYGLDGPAALTAARTSWDHDRQQR